MKRMNKCFVVGSAVLAVLAGARRAAAYTVESPITSGCHEQITADALRAARAKMKTAAPLPLTDDDDGPLLGDLPFTLPDDMNDMGGATLLIGVRDNDVKNTSTTDLGDLAELNSDPSAQHEHCLRTVGELEPTGTKQAIDDCRTFIHDKLVSALDGLGADGMPDVHIRDTLDIALAIRGEITVSVPAFYLRMGQGMHALEDSFTHTFRSKMDPHKITVTLNWIDYADGNLDESTGGPPHLSKLDQCDDADDLRTQRHAMANAATAAVLEAALDPSMTRDQKAKAFDAVLDQYITYDASAHCTSANNWCDAPENQYRPGSCGCAEAGVRVPHAGAMSLLALVAVAARRRRRAGTVGAKERPGRGPAGRALVAGGVATFVVVLSSREARAQQPSPLPEAPEHEASGPVAALKGESQAATPGLQDPAGAFFGRAAFAASYDKPALAFDLGARYQISKPWMIGLDAEWNPWLTLTPKSFRGGAFDAYASIIRRFQLAYESVNLRSTLAGGASVLLIDLVGAPKGSVGPFLGVSFLGVEWKMARGFYLVVDPTYIAFPVPHVTGAPFGYYQYRFQVGLEFGG